MRTKAGSDASENREHFAESGAKMRRLLVNNLLPPFPVSLVIHSEIFLFVRSVELNHSVFNGVTYAIVNACLSMQLITFASLSFLLYKRFRYLCERLLMPEGESIAEELSRGNFIDTANRRRIARPRFSFSETLPVHRRHAACAKRRKNSQLPDSPVHLERDQTKRSVSYLLFFFLVSLARLRRPSVIAEMFVGGDSNFPARQ